MDRSPHVEHPSYRSLRDVVDTDAKMATSQALKPSIRVHITVSTTSQYLKRSRRLSISLMRSSKMKAHLTGLSVFHKGRRLPLHTSYKISSFRCQSSHFNAPSSSMPRCPLISTLPLSQCPQTGCVDMPTRSSPLKISISPPRFQKLPAQDIAESLTKTRPSYDATAPQTMDTRLSRSLPLMCLAPLTGTTLKGCS